MTDKDKAAAWPFPRANREPGLQTELNEALQQVAAACQRVRELEAQRDNLVTALDGLLAVFEYHKEPEKIAAVEAARAALAKAGAA